MVVQLPIINVKEINEEICPLQHSQECPPKLTFHPIKPTTMGAASPKRKGF